MKTEIVRRVLVTGGAGFIGSHLVDALVARKCQVTVLDNLSTGRIENLKTFAKNPLVAFHQADLSKQGDWNLHFKNIDWVFHLAALADIVPSIQKPLTYFNSNVTGTVHVLEAARNYNVKRLVYAASSSCYGIPEKFPTTEHAPISPQYPYALTKYLGEEMVLHWHNVYGLPANSLRFFNVYGPRSRTSGTYGAVFGVFLAQKLAKKPFTVVGDGKQTRDFTFVTDVVDALIKTAESNLIGEVMNVGSGNTYSINQLVQLLGGDVTYIPKRPGEPDCTFADINKINQLLGWKPKISFERGVRVMLDHIKDWQDAPVWTPDKISEATKEWFECLSQKRELP